MNPLIAQARKVEGFEDTPRWYMIWRFHDNWLLRTRAECIICGEYIAEVVHDRYHLDMPHEVKISFFKQIANHASIHSQDVDAPTGPSKPAAVPIAEVELVTPLSNGTQPPTDSSERGQPEAGESGAVVFAEVGKVAASPPAKHPSSASLDTTAPAPGDPARSEPGVTTEANATINEGPPCLTCGLPSNWLASPGIWVHCGRRADG